MKSAMYLKKIDKNKVISFEEKGKDNSEKNKKE